MDLLLCIRMYFWVSSPTLATEVLHDYETNKRQENTLVQEGLDKTAVKHMS